MRGAYFKVKRQPIKAKTARYPQLSFRPDRGDFSMFKSLPSGIILFFAGNPGKSIQMQRNKSLSGWGRYPVVEGSEAFPRLPSQVPELLNGLYLPRGQGRSYGDASLPASGHQGINSSYLDR